MSKKRKILFLIIIVMIVLITHTTSLFLSGSLVCDFALSNNMKEISKALESGSKSYINDFDFDVDWLANSETRSKVEITSFDNLKLAGYQVTQIENTHKWAIFMHGYRGSLFDMTGYAKRFFEKGFNVLLPSERAHGLSEGEYITMGAKESKDLQSWIDFVIETDSCAEIVLHGISMGSSTVMMATGEELPENVKVAIADCGYSSVTDQFLHITKNIMHMNEFPLFGVVEKFAKDRAGFYFSEADMTYALNRSTTPTLFIHGQDDSFVPLYMLDKVYDSAILLESGVTKDKLVVAGAEHIMSASVSPEIYYQKVFEFVEMYID